MNQYELLKHVALYGHKAFGLSATNLAFLSSLLAYHNYITGECWPSNESIQKATGLSASNLARNKKELVNAGVMKTFNKPLGDGKKHSGYYLNINYIEQRFNEILAEEAAREAATATEADVFEPEQQEESTELFAEENPFSGVPVEAPVTLPEATQEESGLIVYPLPYSVPIDDLAPLTLEIKNAEEIRELVKKYLPDVSTHAAGQAVTKCSCLGKAVIQHITFIRK